MPKTELQDRIQQQTLDQVSDTSFCTGSGGTRRGLHSFLPGQSSTAFSEQNCSDGGPDIDFRALRRQHAHCWRQMSPREARQKELVRDVTEKKFHPGFTDKEACRIHDNSFPSFMKRDVDILKRFTQMSCCLRHDLFQGISESIIMSVTLTSAKRCAPLSCSLGTSDTLTTSSILPGLEDLKCMIVDNTKPQVDRSVFPDVHRVIVLLQADHLPTVSRHQQQRSEAASASCRNSSMSKWRNCTSELFGNASSWPLTVRMVAYTSFLVAILVNPFEGNSIKYFVAADFCLSAAYHLWGSRTIPPSPRLWFSRSRSLRLTHLP